MTSDSLLLGYKTLLNLLRYNGIFREGGGTRTPLSKPDESCLSRRLQLLHVDDVSRNEGGPADCRSINPPALKHRTSLSVAAGAR